MLNSKSQIFRNIGKFTSLIRKTLLDSLTRILFPRFLYGVACVCWHVAGCLWVPACLTDLAQKEQSVLSVYDSSQSLQHLGLWWSKSYPDIRVWTLFLSKGFSLWDCIHLDCVKVNLYFLLGSGNFPTKHIKFNQTGTVYWTHTLGLTDQGHRSGSEAETEIPKLEC